ncbi:MAG: beta-ketoacyl-ACP synthase III [Candidatus Aminicenantes bacterium]|nr:beta-ketoacyl-ACP synthase III [Candidatus Aminicenantes bacterium]NIM81346.1 beta-ketoacyl-ACP synthase III [Candidatus Aminicenantes bacterium]NIN20757.1 beta-ketoacyl-ACP synthase III [Candidatus Aminicenantes bacterium]NIN44535.1 beta-ketoacyl-ACP synthase III [Candidatus Aminicenantes bacterium]NIN87355.1 beta-ketoacyl-ACP synthase III [Candidatus Aminicenantes bacterium]
MIRTEILGTGSYLPEGVLTNGDWAERVDTSDEWITTRTGIKERHFTTEDQTTSDMVVEASKKAIEDAGIMPDEIDLIIVGTISGDNAYPSTGNWVQKKLGIRPIPSFDIGAACSGFLYGLIMADALMKTGAAKKILLAGSESMTKIMNWEDRNTCVLFGDGAGAVILGQTEADRGVMSTYWAADGNLGDLLIQPAGGSAMPASRETVEKKLHAIHMNGNEVFKHAVKKMQEASLMAIELANLSSEDIDLFIPHQANIRIIDATIKRARIPLEKTLINIDKTGNMSSASIPVALDQARKEGRLKPGSHLLMASFGAGFTWAGIVVKF